MAEVRDILQKLEQGVEGLQTDAGWKAWLTAQARFHQYSYGNVLLISAQKPDATQVAGYRKWNDFGRYVKKGERGIAILAPMFRYEKRRDVDTGKERSVPILTTFRTVFVFDVSQTDGEPLPEIARDLQGDSNGLLDALLDVAIAEGIPVSEDTLPGEVKGYWSPSDRRIVLAKDVSEAQRAKTLAHELAHAIFDHHYHVEGRETAELEAESVAYVVSAASGLDTGAYSFEYVAYWRGKDPAQAVKEIKASAGRIEKVARRILDALDARRSTEEPVAACA